MRAEGARSQADVLMTVDIGNLVDLVDGGVTQPVKSAVLESVLPANLREPEGHWFALSLRDRVLYAEKDLKLGSFTYEDLADPKWKGKVCVRAGQHPYNTALIAAKIASDGPAEAERWLRGVKANLARKATGGDRDVARDILGGVCDVGLANSYYVGQMKNAAPGSDARKWGDAIQAIRPTFAKSGGTHVNISGAAVAKHAPNRDNAIKLVEFLVSEPAQAIYARANYEYPIRANVPQDPVMAGMGPLKVDPISVAQIARFRKQAFSVPWMQATASRAPCQLRPVPKDGRAVSSTSWSVHGPIGICVEDGRQTGQVACPGPCDLGCGAAPAHAGPVARR